MTTHTHSAALSFPGDPYPYGVWRHGAEHGRAELLDRTRTRSAAEHAARLLDANGLEHCAHLPLGCKLQPIGTNGRALRRVAATVGAL
jgi:hypothetical protein